MQSAITTRLISTVLGALLLAPALSSCVVSTGSRHAFSGKHLEDDVLRRVGSGESKELVLTIFGEPTRKSIVARGTEVWTWEYRQLREETGFSLVGSDRKTSAGAVFVEFDGRTVVRVWRS